jgi:hypothetical protein
MADSALQSSTSMTSCQSGALRVSLAAVHNGRVAAAAAPHRLAWRTEQPMACRIEPPRSLPPTGFARWVCPHSCRV